MVKDNEYNITALHNLIKNVCSGSISVVADDVVGSVLEALHNFLLNFGKDYDSLSKYMEVSNHKFKVLKEDGFIFATPKIYDRYMLELRNRKQENSVLYQDLVGWKDVLKET